MLAQTGGTSPTASAAEPVRIRRRQ